MKAILYDVHSYERAVFDRANDTKTHQLTYVSGPIDPTTARLAEGHAAVIPSLSDVVDAPILETLAKLGVRLIALRSAGYDNLYLTASARLGITAVYVPDYAPHSVAETDDVLARLLSFPRVIVTSHVGYLTWEALGEIAATTLANLTEFEGGGKLEHELKPPRAG